MIIKNCTRIIQTSFLFNMPRSHIIAHKPLIAPYFFYSNTLQVHLEKYNLNIGLSITLQHLHITIKENTTIFCNLDFLELSEINSINDI